jgi:hypothetical protein
MIILFNGQLGAGLGGVLGELGGAGVFLGCYFLVFGLCVENWVEVYDNQLGQSGGGRWGGSAILSHVDSPPINYRLASMTKT